MEADEEAEDQLETIETSLKISIQALEKFVIHQNELEFPFSLDEIPLPNLGSQDREDVVKPDDTLEEVERKTLKMLLLLYEVYTCYFLSFHPDFSKLTEKIVTPYCWLFKFAILKEKAALNVSKKIFFVLEGEVTWNSFIETSNGLTNKVLHTYGAGEMFIIDDFLVETKFKNENEIKKRTKIDELFINPNQYLLEEDKISSEEYIFRTNTNKAVLLILCKEDLSEKMYKTIEFLVLKSIKRRSISIISLFDKYTKEELNKLADVVELRQYKVGEVVVKQGDFDGDFFMITKGSVSFTRSNCNDIPDELRERIGPLDEIDLTTTTEEIEIGQFFAGKTFGEGSSLLGLRRRASGWAVGFKPEIRDVTTPTVCLTTLVLSNINLAKYMSNDIKEKLKEDYFIRVLHGVKEPTSKYKENSQLYSGKDLEIKILLGSGGFSSVFLVSHKITGMTYALKCIKHETLLELKGIERLKKEHEMLYSFSCPFIISLFASFKSEDYVFSLYEVILGGELTSLIYMEQTLTVFKAMFYIAQIILAVEYLHERDIVHRDLKPENMMLTRKGYLKLADFDTAKQLKNTSKDTNKTFERSDSMRIRLESNGGMDLKVYNNLKVRQKEELKTYTFCGTPVYCAPEVFMYLGHGKSADVWSIGIIFYELITREKLIDGRSGKANFRKIVKYCSRFPEVPRLTNLWRKNLVNLDFADMVEFQPLIEDFLNPFSKHRPTLTEAKKYPFIKDFPWEKLIAQVIPPPILPEVKTLNDSRNYSSRNQCDPEEAVGAIMEVSEIIRQLEKSTPLDLQVLKSMSTAQI